MSKKGTPSRKEGSFSAIGKEGLMSTMWDQFRVKEGDKVDLKKWDTSYKGDLTKEEVYDHLLPANGEAFREAQEVMYADNQHGLIIVIQAMDAAGKDGLIKKVLTYINPQGLKVIPFDEPTADEQDHDYLWRCNQALPRRGEVAVFNRSHYEDVLVTRVHNLLEGSQLPEDLVDKKIWSRRYKQIRNWEEYLEENGFHILKFFLHVSKDEQAERLLERVVQPNKNWKFSSSDIRERKYWKEYQKIYEELMEETSTDQSPWFIIPADRKWYTRYVVSEILKEFFEKLDMDYPKLAKEEEDLLADAKESLMRDLGLKEEDLDKYRG